MLVLFVVCFYARLFCVFCDSVLAGDFYCVFTLLLTFLHCCCHAFDLAMIVIVMVNVMVIMKVSLILAVIVIVIAIVTLIAVIVLGIIHLIFWRLSALLLIAAAIAYPCLLRDYPLFCFAYADNGAEEGPGR